MSLARCGSDDRRPIASYAISFSLSSVGDGESSVLVAACWTSATAVLGVGLQVVRYSCRCDLNFQRVSAFGFV